MLDMDAYIVNAGKGTEDDDAQRAPRKPEERDPDVNVWKEKSLHPTNV